MDTKRQTDRVSAFDAKTHLSQLLQEAEHGKTITITSRGKPVARLVPMELDISLQRAAETSPDLARAVRENPPGKAVTVYYNPGNPSVLFQPQRSHRDLQEQTP